MSEAPPPAPSIKPDFVYGDACENCWKFIKPHGCLFKNPRRRDIWFSGQGQLHFCDDECLQSYMYEGMGLYDQGARYGYYKARQDLLAGPQGWPDYVE